MTKRRGRQSESNKWKFVGNIIKAARTKYQSLLTEFEVLVCDADVLVLKTECNCLSQLVYIGQIYLIINCFFNIKKFLQWVNIDLH